MIKITLKVLILSSILLTNLWANQDSLPSGKGIATSIVPGILLHGSGHYFAGYDETGKDLLVLSGIGIGTAAIGITGLAFSGGADEFAPYLIPMSILGITTYLSTWIFDIAGVSGLKGVNTDDTPDQWNYFRTSILYQENTRNDLHRFYQVQGQFATESFFINTQFEREWSGDFSELQLTVGVPVLHKIKYRLTLKPEFKWKYSNEGFGITQYHGLVELENKLGSYFPTLNGWYWVHQLGYGVEFFHFDGADINYSNALMIIGQGIRYQASKRWSIYSMLKRREDEMIGGRDYSLFYFEHRLRWQNPMVFADITFTHGMGYRLNSSVGVKF